MGCSVIVVGDDINGNEHEILSSDGGFIDDDLICFWCSRVNPPVRRQPLLLSIKHCWSKNDVVRWFEKLMAAKSGSVKFALGQVEL